MTWKITNISDTGTSIKFGADDTDKISKLFSGIDVDDVDINSDFKFRDGKLQLSNPANSFKYTINTSAILADRILNVPLLTGTDTLAVLGLSQTFTASQTIQNDPQGDVLYLYRSVNSVDANIDLNFDMNDSLGNRMQYADLRVRIKDATDGSEDAAFYINTVIGGTKNERLRIDESGNLLWGPNVRGKFSETGLTAERTFTFPDTDDQLAGRDAVQAIKNKTFTVGYGNTGGNIFNGMTLENPYLTTETGSTVIRTGLFHGTGSVNADGILDSGSTAIGSTASDRSTTEGFGYKYSTGAVANANAGLRWTTTVFRREWGNYVILRIHPSSTSDIRCFVGWSSDTAEIAGETTLNNFSGCGVGKRTGDTNWFTYRNDGDATEDRVDTGLAFAASPVTIELALNSTNFRSRIGSTENTAQTTELPSSSVSLGLHVEIETGAGAVDKNIIIYPIYARLGAI